MQFPEKASKRGQDVPWTFILDHMVSKRDGVYRVFDQLLFLIRLECPASVLLVDRDGGS